MARVFHLQACITHIVPNVQRYFIIFCEYGFSYKRILYNSRGCCTKIVQCTRTNVTALELRAVLTQYNPFLCVLSKNSDLYFFFFFLNTRTNTEIGAARPMYWIVLNSYRQMRCPMTYEPSIVKKKSMWHLYKVSVEVLILNLGVLKSS